MKALTMHVDIVSAEKEIFSGLAEMLVANLVNGEVGILPRHTPLLARMKPGEVRVKTPTEELSFYVSGGLLEVQPHVVTVLADTALRARDIDEAEREAKRNFQRAGIQDLLPLAAVRSVAHDGVDFRSAKAAD